MPTKMPMEVLVVEKMEEHSDSAPKNSRKSLSGFGFGGSLVSDNDD